MNPVIFIVSIVVAMSGILGAIFNRRVDLWMRAAGARVFPSAFRESFESAFGDPAQGRTALKVSIGFIVIGVLMLTFGPVVS